MTRPRHDDDPADRTAREAPPGADRAPNGELAPPLESTAEELHEGAVEHPERERVRMDEEDGGQPPHQEGERRSRTDR